MLKFCVFLIVGVAVCCCDRIGTSSMRGSRRLLGTEKCERGPGYWCDKIKNAKECGAVPHCLQSIWLKHKEPQDDSPLCRWCDDLMDNVRDALNGTISKATLKGTLKDACKRIPQPELRSACIATVTSDMPEMMTLLGSGVGDRTVCKTISFCDDRNRQETPRITENPSNRNVCADCYHFFEDAKEIYLGNYTADEFKDMLLQSCDQAGYPALTELCKTVIEQYWPQIYARLQFFFDPSNVCYQINFCNSTITGRRPSIPLTKLIPAAKKSSVQSLPLERMLLNVGSLQKAPNQMPKTVKNDVECVLCEFVMSYVDRILEDNYTEASIQSALDRVCGYMPKSVRSDCQSFVDQYAPAILVLLGNELDPAMVCNGLQLCHNGSKAICGSSSCPACKEVFQVIKTLLESYEESARLAQLIQSFCNQLPGTAQRTCVDAVVAYVPYILQILGQLMNPEAVCHAVKMC